MHGHLNAKFCFPCYQLNVIGDRREVPAVLVLFNKARLILLLVFSDSERKIV